MAVSHSGSTCGTLIYKEGFFSGIRYINFWKRNFSTFWSHQTILGSRWNCEVAPLSWCSLSWKRRGKIHRPLEDNASRWAPEKSPCIVGSPWGGVSGTAGNLLIHISTELVGHFGTHLETAPIQNFKKCDCNIWSKYTFRILFFPYAQVCMYWGELLLAMKHSAF